MGGILLKTTGQCITHMLPLVSLVYPPLLGGFFNIVVNDDGDSMYSTCHPSAYFVPPIGGECI